MQNIRNTIDEKGWIEIENIHSDSELLNLAKKIGTVINHPNGEKISHLKPKEKNNSLKGTLSNNFGLGSFPLHTDTAFWAIPVRYVILSSTQKSSSSTHIIHFNKIWDQLNEKNKSLARKAIYIIKTINGQHYASLIFKENGIEGFRFDPCTMIPFNESAKEIHKKIEETLNHLMADEILWTGNNSIIIDNWKTLHGRSSVNEQEQRIMKRIYIY